MSRKHYIGNAILWAAAIIASALLGAPPVFTTILLPSLATCALLITRPQSRTAPCRT